MEKEESSILIISAMAEKYDRQADFASRVRQADIVLLFSTFASINE